MLAASTSSDGVAPRACAPPNPSVPIGTKAARASGDLIGDGFHEVARAMIGVAPPSTWRRQELSPSRSMQPIPAFDLERLVPQHAGSS